MRQRESKASISKEDLDLDFILNDIGGTFSKFQIVNYLLLGFAMFSAGASVLDYVFSTLQPQQRYVQRVFQYSFFMHYIFLLVKMSHSGVRYWRKYFVCT